MAAVLRVDLVVAIVNHSGAVYAAAFDEAG
jgi:hypothetical protein